MCNLYSVTKGQAAIIELTRAMRDSTGNLPPMPGVFPDYKAPVVANRGGVRELCLMRWGMPSSQKALLDAASKRAEKLRAKGTEPDFKELFRLEPDSGVTNMGPDAGERCQRPRLIQGEPDVASLGLFGTCVSDDLLKARLPVPNRAGPSLAFPLCCSGSDRRRELSGTVRRL
jgi:hypothetical protein